MSEQENNEPMTIQGKQSQQRTHAHCQKKGQCNFEPKKKDADSITIFKYGPCNNFRHKSVECKMTASFYCRQVMYLPVRKV